MDHSCCSLGNCSQLKGNHPVQEITPGTVYQRLMDSGLGAWVYKSLTPLTQGGTGLAPWDQAEAGLQLGPQLAWLFSCPLCFPHPPPAESTTQ